MLETSELEYANQVNTLVAKLVVCSPTCSTGQEKRQEWLASVQVHLEQMRDSQ